MRRVNDTGNGGSGLLNELIEEPPIPQTGHTRPGEVMREAGETTHP